MLSPLRRLPACFSVSSKCSLYLACSYLETRYTKYRITGHPASSGGQSGGTRLPVPSETSLPTTLALVFSPPIAADPESWVKITCFVPPRLFTFSFLPPPPNEDKDKTRMTCVSQHANLWYPGEENTPPPKSAAPSSPASAPASRLYLAKMKPQGSGFKF